MNNIKPKKLAQRKKQAEATRRKIMDTALCVFASRGFSRTSIKALAIEAGISQGLMYHYFTNKEKLLEDIIEYYSFLPQLRKMLENTGGRPCCQVLQEISTEFLNLMDRRDKVIRIFIQEVITNPKIREVLSNIINTGVVLLQKYLSDCIETGELKPHNTEVTCRLLFPPLIMFHFSQDIFPTRNITSKEFTREVMDVLMEGLENKQNQ